MLPDVVATIDEQPPRTDLRRTDLRRTAADDILRRLQKANGKAAPTEAERGVIVAAVRTAYSTLEREYLRIGSFRRLILVASGVLAVIAVAIAVTAALYPTVLPICFTPGLSNLDTSAQIVAWALVFGYAQQLVTRMVDERGQAVLAAVGGPENPEKA